LETHDLNCLINTLDIAERLDAIPRIHKPVQLTADYMRHVSRCGSLIELEHIATWSWLSNYKMQGEGAQTSPATLQGWLNQHWFLTALAQQLTPFRHSEPSIKVFLVFDNDQNTSRFCEKNEEGYADDRENILNIQRIALAPQARSRLWLVRDYDRACAEFADKSLDSQQPLSQRRVSLRYGELNFPHNEKQQYAYNDQLGLVKL
jgi:CRISPR-associated endonuclease/helicase Cas3